MSTKEFTCNASSEYGFDYACSKTYDSNTGTDWATNNEGPGAWIKIQFPEYIQLSKIETRHRREGWYSGDNFKNITLSFSDGTNKSASIEDGTHPEWNVIKINPVVKSKYINISATSVHGTHILNPGYSEIRFYGCPGMA